MPKVKTKQGKRVVKKFNLIGNTPKQQLTCYVNSNLSDATYSAQVIGDFEAMDVGLGKVRDLTFAVIGLLSHKQAESLIKK